MTSDARIDTDEDGWEHTTYPSGIITSTPPDLLSQGIHRVERRLDAIENLLRILTTRLPQPSGEDQLPGEDVVPVAGHLDDQRPEPLTRGRRPEIDHEGCRDVLEEQAVDRQIEGDSNQINVIRHGHNVEAPCLACDMNAVTEAILQALKNVLGPS